MSNQVSWSSGLFYYLGKKLSLAAILASPLLILLVPAQASAASSFTDHLWEFVSGVTNTVDFHDSSKIFSTSGNLHVSTQGNLYLDTPQTVIANNNIRGKELQTYNSTNNTYTGSKIYDNGDLHIGTDDFLFLDGTHTFVQGALTAGGTITGNLTGDVTGNVTAASGSSSFNDLTVNGTLTADFAVSNDLTGVTGDFTVGTGELGGDLTVNGETIANGDIYLQNSSVLRSGVSGCGILGSDAVCVGSEGENNNLAVWGNSGFEGNLNVLGGDLTVSSGNTTNLNGAVNLGTDVNDVIAVNGRLYGEGGDSVTIGRHSDLSGLKVWGSEDLRGDFNVGGWGTPNNQVAFNVQTDCGYGFGSGGCIALGANGQDADVQVNGHLTVVGGTFVGDGGGITNIQDSSLSGNVALLDSVSSEFTGDLTVDGDANFGGDVNVNVGGFNVLGGDGYFANDLSVDGTIFGGLTGDVNGNATTADTATVASTADSANSATTADGFTVDPTDCGAGAFANAIAANGNLTCGTDGSSITNVDAATLEGHDSSYFAHEGSSASFTDVTTSDLTVGGVVNLGKQTFTVLDNSDGSNATGTLNPSKSYVSVDCQDNEACDVTMSEAGASDGDIVVIVNSSSKNVNFTDSAGVTELSGNATLGQYSSLTLLYSSNRWVQLAKANN